MAMAAHVNMIPIHNLSPHLVCYLHRIIPFAANHTQTFIVTVCMIWNLFICFKTYIV